MGDFNARHSTWWNGQATDEIGRALCDFASSNGLVQLVQGATRHPGGAAAAQLDLMFLNEISCVQACTVLPQLSGFEFLVIFDFIALWYRRSREASSVKIS